MSLGVGIHENVILANVEHLDKDGKKSIIISFRGKKEKSLFEMMSGDEMVDNLDDKTSIRIFPFKVPDKNDLTDQQKAQRVIGDVNRARNQCMHILLCYLPKNEVSLNIYENTGIAAGISDADFTRAMLNPALLDKIWNNLQSTFIRLIKPLCDRDDLPMRLKLIRQSAEKHYATLPGTYLESQPFLEPMQVSKEASRVKFSDYEIQKGLDKADQVPSSAADPLPEGELDSAEVDKALFEPTGDE